MWQQVSWIIAGVFAAIAVSITCVQLYLHLTNYTQPDQQRYIIRILLMVPVYAVDSLLSLVLHPTAIYWNTLRNCYEAFVIYSFFSLLLTYLGGPEVLEGKLRELPNEKHMFPCCCLPTFAPGGSFLRRCRQGTLQFVLVKLVTTAVALICELAGVLYDGQLRPDGANLYLLVLDNLSVTLSMYCLLLFYTVCSELLKPFRPVPKFVCVKAIIFFSFWQGVVLSVLVSVGVITDVGDWSPHEISTALQNFIICIEMVGAALAHHYAFPYTAYKGETRTPLLPMVKSTMQVRDVVHDTITLFGARSVRLGAGARPGHVAGLGPSYGAVAESESAAGVDAVAGVAVVAAPGPVAVTKPLSVDAPVGDEDSGIVA